MRRELSAERRAHSFSQPLWFAGPKNPIGKKRRKKIDRKKLASFGPLCLSSDSTRCQESESLSDLKNRRAIRPDLKLPFWTLYFRHYEVGAPCRSGHVWCPYRRACSTWGRARMMLECWARAGGAAGWWHTCCRRCVQSLAASNRQACSSPTRKQPRFGPSAVCF